MKAFHESYANALYEVADEMGVTDVILGELQSISALLSENGDYAKLLDSPTIPTDAKLSLADESFGLVNVYLLNFIKILVENKCFGEFSKIYESFSSLYDEKHNILRATATSVLPLDKEQAEQITARLEAKTGKKVVLSNTVDPSVIGGVKLSYGGEEIDKSIKTTLKTIGNLISSTDI